MILLPSASRTGPDPAARIAKRSTLIGCSVVKINCLSIHSDSQDMIHRHMDRIAGIPLDTGQDQKTVVLPQMPDLAMVRNGYEIIARFPR